jgi:SAM-dependent methyltransferase
VNTADAVRLIETAIPTDGKAWADLGAGDGTFTRALVELLGPKSRIYAVDRDARALAALERWATKRGANVSTVVADFTHPSDLPELTESKLDGILLANALHFVRDAETVLAGLVRWLRPGGRAVLIEYDRRGASRWVPYPIPVARLAALAISAGLSTPIVTATRPSAFGGSLRGGGRSTRAVERAAGLYSSAPRVASFSRARAGVAWALRTISGRWPSSRTAGRGVGGSPTPGGRFHPRPSEPLRSLQPLPAANPSMSLG